jgi:uncharacterized protein YjiS (DUF1127 family)
MFDRTNPPPRLAFYEIERRARLERNTRIAACLRSAATATVAVFRDFARACIRLAHRIAADRRLRNDMRAFQKFDDRMLADIGVCRGEIEYIVRYGRPASTRLIAAMHSRRRPHSTATAGTGINWA